MCSVRGHVYSTHARPPIHCLCDATFPAEQVTAATPPTGPGVELEALIARCQRFLPWWNMRPEEGCGCEATARWMDCLGPDGCEAHLEEIVDRLEAEAARREISFPFRRTIAAKMVRGAIRRARKAR